MRSAAFGRSAVLLCDEPDVAIALALRVRLPCARHCRRTWRDDDVRQRIGLAAGDSLVHGLAVVRAVGRHGRDLALDLPEQRRHLTGIIDSIVGQHAGDELAGIGIDGDMELAPGPARPTVLLLVPLALAEELE